MEKNKHDTGQKKKFGLRRFVSPAFLVMLFISFSMWYLTKLDSDYTAEIPVTVNVGGNEFRTRCMVTAPGRQMLSYRVFRRSRVDLDFEDVETTPSVLNPGHYVISPNSLQTAISLANNNIRIVSIGEIPEITYKGE